MGQLLLQLQRDWYTLDGNGPRSGGCEDFWAWPIALKRAGPCPAAAVIFIKFYRCSVLTRARLLARCEQAAGRPALRWPPRSARQCQQWPTVLAGVCRPLTASRAESLTVRGLCALRGGSATGLALAANVRWAADSWCLAT